MLLSALIGPALVTTAPAPVQKVVRHPLTTATFAKTKAVDRVEVKEITLPAGTASGPHRHPCPVVGYVVSGTVFFQIQCQPAKLLKPGDAFYEPANTVIQHFDARSKPLRFIANYLLSKGETKLIEAVNTGRP